MFGKMTKGQLIALTAILKMNTARNSEESVPGRGIRIYGNEPQLTDVALIVDSAIHVFWINSNGFACSCCFQNKKLFVSTA